MIQIELKKRTTEQLKEDAKAAMTSNDENSTTIFVLILNVLEERMTPEQYSKFEESL